MSNIKVEIYLCLNDLFIHSLKNVSYHCIDSYEHTNFEDVKIYSFKLISDSVLLKFVITLFLYLNTFKHGKKTNIFYYTIYIVLDTQLFYRY